MSIDFACQSAVRLLTDNSIEIPRQVLVNACMAFKTVNYFLRVLNDDVVALYRGEISESSFVDNLADLIELQLRRAWNEGMRANGLDPAEDMLPEWEEAYQNVVADEYDYVDRFAADIVAGARVESGVEQFQSRAALWANRYKDVVNRAVLETATGRDRLEWQIGATEAHCETCQALNGIIAFASEWQTAQVVPQSPPNNNLTCGGWRCDCSLVPTDKRRTARALNEIMNVIVARNL